ncbi:hypothetical protein HK098_004271 [Nowakowskiella sp. JEL0407]|nr:hypothetical protein HK098_004271 [Nowakowskiella sp. JEL0407]
MQKRRTAFNLILIICLLLFYIVQYKFILLNRFPFASIEADNDQFDLIYQPCTSTNNYYAIPHFRPKIYPESELSSRRADWQTWLKTNNFDTFTSASRKMHNLNLPKMEGRGIAITIGGDSQFEFLKMGVRMLRKHGCRLQIEVWSFFGELSPDARDEILRLDENISLRYADDIRNFSPFDRGTGQGYHCKYAAVINSGFEELLFLDVDVFVFKNPQYLFDSFEYRRYGTLFWPDYWKTRSDNPVWNWMGQKCFDEWEQESGIMVINKKRAWKALSLLWYLNRNDEIRNWHSTFLLGDKDLFRFSWRATNTSVHYIQHMVSPGGFLTSRYPDGTGPQSFCGLSMIQHDTTGNMLFAHVNIFKRTNNKRFNSTYLPLSYVKKYVPVQNSLNNRSAWAGSKGAKAVYARYGEYNCVDIVENHPVQIKEDVERRAVILRVKDYFPEFEKDLYDVFLKKRIERDVYRYHQKKRIANYG